MEINKKELKKISRNFRLKVSRVIQADYREVISIIKMLVDYIDETELIHDYIVSVTKENYNIQKDVESVAKSYGRNILNTGNTPEEEVSYIYQLLKHICKNNIDVSVLGMGYTSSNSFQDMVRAFSQRIVLPFANQIDEYIMDIAIDMGYDEEEKFMINVNGGQAQVNIANDSSTINSIQNNKIDNNEIEKVVDSIKELLTDEIDKNLKELVKGNSQLILEEVNKEKPKSQIIKSLYNSIKFAVNSVPKSVALIEGIDKLGKLIQQFL
jgi:hypothetical protein